MTEAQFRDLLGDLLVNTGLEDMEVLSAVSFREACLMTNSEGLLVTMDDGSEFQLKIVKSK